MRAIGFALCVSVCVNVSGCSSKKVHEDLWDDPKVMVRQWTRITRPEFDTSSRGTEYSNPVLYDNTIIFGNQSVGLVALYSQKNLVRWVLPIPHGVISPVHLVESNVFFGGGDGYLYCVDASRGRVKWRYSLRNPVISEPTFKDGRLFVTTSDDTVYALDAGSGQWLWHYRRRTSQTASILGASQPLVHGNDVLVGLSDGFLVALSVQDGKLKWERKLHQGKKFTDVDAHPLLVDQTLYVPSYDGNLYALERLNGRVIWKFETGGSKQVLVDGPRLILPGSDGFIYALKRESGEVIWKFEMDGGTPTDIVVAGPYLVFGSSHEYLYALDKASGKPVYRFQTGYDSGFSGAPLFDPKTNQLFILSGGGNLMAFSLRGQIRQRKFGQTDPYL